ncbi:MAG TPA: polyprenol phosphomannose-dependent alpha 1,6 mannosyltransferase MptB [Conexibacter sp.]|nr:polyprenol phosphomannose-dependent alpha 1,6 mannosyltransferase MptB [Conexibacter sp.]
MRRSDLTRLTGVCALVGLLAASALLAVGASARRRLWFVPGSEHGGLPGWLAGPFHRFELVLLPPRGALLLVLMTTAYLVALACARAGAIPARLGIGAVLGAHIVFLLAPPLFSADMFGYVDYARLWVLHGLDPYVHVPADAPADPALPFVRWREVSTPYGPLFTLLSTPLAGLSVPAAVWAWKAAAAALSLGCCALVWRIAQRRELDPLRALLFVGLNPLLLAYGVGGAHNDFMLLALALGAVLLALEARAFPAGALGVLAVGVKAPAAVLLPFLLLSTRTPRRMLAGVLAATAVLLAFAFVAFQREAFGFVAQIREQQQFVAAYSVPNRVASMLGFDALPAGLRLLFACAFAASVAALLWATWRGRIDWLTAAGWAMLALLVSTAWLVPWYVVWALPLAAVARDPRLRGATLLFCLYVVATRVTYQLV